MYALKYLQLLEKMVSLDGLTRQFLEPLHMFSFNICCVDSVGIFTTSSFVKH